MPDDQKPPSTDRRSFIKEIVGGTSTLIYAILAIRHDRREEEKHDLARADRQQGRIVHARAVGHSHSSGYANATVISSADRVTIPI